MEPGLVGDFREGLVSGQELPLTTVGYAFGR